MEGGQWESERVVIRREETLVYCVLPCFGLFLAHRRLAVSVSTHLRIPLRGGDQIGHLYATIVMNHLLIIPYLIRARITCLRQGLSSMLSQEQIECVERNLEKLLLREFIRDHQE